MFNPLAAPVSNLVGWALPAYLSFKAIESPQHADDVQWLTYWVVFGFFNFLESFALRLVLYYVPWYFAFKTAFIVWLQLPVFRVSVCLLLRSCYGESASFRPRSLFFRPVPVLPGRVPRYLFTYVISSTLPLTIYSFHREPKSLTNLS